MTARPSTAFYLGKRLYHGENFEIAWALLQAAVGSQQVPEWMKKYAKAHPV